MLMHIAHELRIWKRAERMREEQENKNGKKKRENKLL